MLVLLVTCCTSQAKHSHPVGEHTQRPLCNKNNTCNACFNVSEGCTVETLSTPSSCKWVEINPYPTNLTTDPQLWLDAGDSCNTTADAAVSPRQTLLGSRSH